jgi:hypothetical protein
MQEILGGSGEETILSATDETKKFFEGTDKDERVDGGGLILRDD